MKPYTDWAFTVDQIHNMYLTIVVLFLQLLCTFITTVCFSVFHWRCTCNATENFCGISSENFCGISSALDVSRVLRIVTRTRKWKTSPPWSFPFCWCRWMASPIFSWPCSIDGNCQCQRRIIRFMGIFDVTWPRCSCKNITIRVTTCSLSLNIFIQVAGSTRPLYVVRDTYVSLTNWHLAARLLERELEAQILQIGFCDNVSFYYFT